MKKIVPAVLALLLLCSLFPVSAAETEAGIPILMYHHVAQLEEYNTMTVSPQRFREDMEFLRDNGFTPLLPGDLIRIAAGEMEKPLRPVMITFDDGYESNYTEAFPILKETGMKATIALIAQSVRISPEKKLWTMTWAQCREMAESGLVAFGSHSFNLHNPDNGSLFRTGGPNGIQRLAGETREDYTLRVGRDLRNSVSIIENLLGCEVNYFAYPFGVTDEWFYDLLAAEDIWVTVTTDAAAADLSRGTMDLPRLRVDMSAPLSQLLADYARPVSCTSSYVAVSLAGKVSYLPSVISQGRHYVDLRDIAHLLAKTPAAFTFGEPLVIERGNYRGKWNQEIIEGRSVDMLPVSVSLTLGEAEASVICLRTADRHYFAPEDLGELLGYLCVPAYTALPEENTPAVYTITFPG